MMKKILFVIISAGFITFSYSQTIPFQSKLQHPVKYCCGTKNAASSLSFSGNLPHKTPEFGRYLRMAMIYVRFPDDNLQGDPMNGYGVWWNSSWIMPRNIYYQHNTFLEAVEKDPSIPFMNRYSDYTISDYFSEMSRGEFDVIGLEYGVILPKTSDEYRQLGYNYSQINREAIILADSIYNIDFAHFNNWTLINNQWTWTPRGGDNVAEMVAVVYRRAPGYPEDPWFFNLGIPVSGISDLGFSDPINLDNTTINFLSGVTCLSLMRNYSRLTQIVEHEFSHRYFPRHYEIGLMTGVEHTSFSYSPRERWLLEYVNPTVINPPYSKQSEIFTLGDFTATGDMVVITLPGVRDDERFIIANHQKISKYDGISQGGKICWDINKTQQDPYCGYGKGLYIYSESPPGECNFSKEIEIKQADGKHNWYIDRWVPYYLPEFNFDIPLFEKTGGNLLGKSEYHQVLDTVFNFFQQEVNDNPCSDISEDYFVTTDWRGEGLDGFNINYDEIFSPYSNPRSSFCDGSPSGITIALMSQDTSNGNFTVKVYYDDNLALQELPPSKPKNLFGSKLILDSLTGRFHPRLRWDLNIEPDFITGGSYNIFRGILMSCDPETEPAYDLIGNVSANTIEFTDESITLFPYGGGTIECEGLFRSLSYKIEAVDNSTKISLKSERAIINGYISMCDDSVVVGISGNEIPLEFSVFNYPNPFNPSTHIKYSLPKNAIVTIKIYNLLGEEIENLVSNEYKAAGRHNVLFDGTNLPSGVYFYTINAGAYFESKKMVLVK
jgi:hypothetical protein